MTYRSPARGLVLAQLCFTCALVGCGPRAAPETSKALPLAGTDVNLLVVDDEPLVKSISLLRGQWESETGGKLHVKSLSHDALAESIKAGQLAGDAVIYAPRLLGTLAEGKLIKPLEPKAKDEGIDSADVFELLKSRETTWGSEVLAVPLGEPVLLCFFREDLLQALGKQPPRTWKEYQDLAQALAAKGPTAAANSTEAPSSQAWSGTIEPLAPGWAGLTLLARAASYARHPNHYSTLFNVQSMEPLVASPPFVRALVELVAAANSSSTAAGAATPEDAWRALLNNEAGMALCWPAAVAPAAGGKEIERSTDVIEIGSVEIPGADEVFNPTSGKWERRSAGSLSVPVLGFVGRLGSVLGSSSQPQAALHLLAWLSGPKWSERALSASDATAPFRQSSVAAPEAWSRGLRTGEAKQYCATVAASLSAPECLMAPRIPGAERYLQALDEGVIKAVSGRASPQEALSAAAEEFCAITAELGLDRQRAAYRQSLGL